MNVLEIKGLTKKFGDFIAVDQLSLNIREGEIFGFLGANGAGKSTTINIISSLMPHDQGRGPCPGQESDEVSKVREAADRHGSARGRDI